MKSKVSETERLVESRRLLEAHARLMELERWQDEVLLQVCAPGGGSGQSLAPQDEQMVRDYFSGVGRLVEALGKELWTVVGSSLALARQNPTLFVSAVRIIEREEALDQALLEERGPGVWAAAGTTKPLPPGRPRYWRERSFRNKHYVVLNKATHYPLWLSHGRNKISSLGYSRKPWPCDYQLLFTCLCLA